MGLLNAIIVLGLILVLNGCFKKKPEDNYKSDYTIIYEVKEVKRDTASENVDTVSVSGKINS